MSLLSQGDASGYCLVFKRGFVIAFPFAEANFLKRGSKVLKIEWMDGWIDEWMDEVGLDVRENLGIYEHYVLG